MIPDPCHTIGIERETTHMTYGQEMTFYAMLLSTDSADACQYVGPFLNEEDADDYVDSMNNGLQMNGHPALWQVV